MTEIETPTDDPTPPSSPSGTQATRARKRRSRKEKDPHQPARVPNRGTRHRVMGKGEGDFCLYSIAPENSDLPTGSLVPIPEVPRFESHAKALTWVRQKSGDKLAGKQVILFRAVEIFRVQTITETKVQLERKPKQVVNEPANVDGE